MTLLTNYSLSIMRGRRGRKALPKTKKTDKLTEEEGINKNNCREENEVHSSFTNHKVDGSIGKEKPSMRSVLHLNNINEHDDALDKVTCNSSGEKAVPSVTKEQKPFTPTKGKRGRPRKVDNKNVKEKTDDQSTATDWDDILQKQREIFNSKPLSDTDEEEATKSSIASKEKTTPTPTKRKRGRAKKVDKKKAENESQDDQEPPSKMTKNECSESPNKNNSEEATEEEEQIATNKGKKDEKKKSKKGSNDDPSSYVMCVLKDDKGSKYKAFKCRICMKEASAKADLIKHIRVHTGERPFKCKICNASFVQITALRGHETIHTGEKPFICDVCGKKFAIKDRLRLHMRVHTGEKPHQCDLCNLSFARRSQVSQHMRIHDAVKNKFKCDECGSSFASYHTLKAHVNSHLGIKEFQCIICGKKFLRVEGMYKHIRTVHRGNRPYTCNICGKAFKGHLQQHMRLHKGVRPYTCHLCDAAFTQNSQLTVHLRIHTGERPYKCQVCGSSFAHSSACKIHMRSHTGEKPFKCVLCVQAFSQLPHLKKHMKCVHGADKPYMCLLCKEFFKTQAEIDAHRRFTHNLSKTAEEEAQETVEESTLARLRNRLAVLLYRISSEDRRIKFGFGNQLIDEVLKLSLESSGHAPVSDSSLTPLEELRQNVLQLLRWTIPQETMEEYHKNNMTVDEVLDMLTS